MFRAITKDPARAPNANSKGTLSALWAKKTQSKLNDGAAEPEDRGADGVEAREESFGPTAAAASERTPEPAARQVSQQLQGKEAGGAAAAPATGDLPAAPEPAKEAEAAGKGAEVLADKGNAGQVKEKQAPLQVGAVTGGPRTAHF